MMPPTKYTPSLIDSQSLLSVSELASIQFQSSMIKKGEKNSKKAQQKFNNHEQKMSMTNKHNTNNSTPSILNDT